MFNFKLDDPKYLYNLEIMDISELEPLYWIIEDCLLNGETNKARALFKQFIYFAKLKPEFLRKGLQEDYINRLKSISFELFADSAPTEYKSIEFKSFIKKQNLGLSKEFQLRDFLVSKPGLLSDIVKDEIKTLNKEVVINNEYRCDLVATSKKYLYPIEVKIAEGDHKVVSQILKYCFYFYRRCRYYQFKKVQGIVISNGFDDYAINELRRQNIYTVTVLPSMTDKIKLELIS